LADRNVGQQVGLEWQAHNSAERHNSTSFIGVETMHSQRSSKIAVPVSVARDYSFLRQTLLLATALFLIAAPALNAQDIAELTANFLIG
jgi:hypothetical protein